MCCNSKTLILALTLSLSNNNTMMTNNPHQRYTKKPLHIDEVVGASSESIFRVMTGMPWPGIMCAPLDVDDLDKNYALLLQYPEWCPRMAEMSAVSDAWRKIIKYWDIIMELYLMDLRDGRYWTIDRQDNMNLFNGMCNKFLITLIKQ